MSDTTLVVKPTELLGPIDIGPGDLVLKGFGQRVAGAKSNSLTEYRFIMDALRESRGYRKQIKTDHKDIKQSAWDYGKACDVSKNESNETLDAIEKPLKLEQKRWEDEKQRVKQEKLDAIRKAEEALARAEVERLRKEQEAKDAEIKRAQEAEDKRLAEERIKLESDQADARRKQQAEDRRQAEQRRLIEADRLKVEEDKRKLEAADRQRQQAIEKENREIQEAKEERERKAELLRLAEERKPDSAKLAQFADTIDAIEWPSVETEWAKNWMAVANLRLSSIADDLRGAVIEAEV